VKKRPQSLPETPHAAESMAAGDVTLVIWHSANEGAEHASMALPVRFIARSVSIYGLLVRR